MWRELLSVLVAFSIVWFLRKIRVGPPAPPRAPSLLMRIVQRNDIPSLTPEPKQIRPTMTPIAAPVDMRSSAAEAAVRTTEKPEAATPASSDSLSGYIALIDTIVLNLEGSYGKLQHKLTGIDSTVKPTADPDGYPNMRGQCQSIVERLTALNNQLTLTHAAL